MTAFDTAMVRFRNKDFTGAVELFASVPASDPKYFRAQVGLGKAFYALHKYDAAIEHFSRATSSDYDKPQIAYQGLAVSLAEVGRYDEAISAMEQSINIDPSNADAVYNLGQIQSRAGHYLSAAESFQRAFVIKAEPAYLAYGALCYSNAGDYPNAITMCERALSANDKSHLAHDVLAITYARKGDYEIAMHHSNIAIGLCPEDAGYVFNRGCTFRALAKYTDAISDYSRAIDLSPRVGKYYTNRANCYIAVSEYSAAIDDLNVAIRYGDDVAYFNRANLNIKLERYEDALADLNHFIALGSNHKDAYVARALVFSLLGRTSESEADYLRSARL
jgi:tetratricopeptide (TPR) repeat protein